MSPAFTGLRGPITLSASTYGTLWDYDNRGLQHPTLFVNTPIRYGTDLEDAQDAAMRELGNAGLLVGNAPHPDLRAAFDLITNAEWEYYGWLSTGPERMFGLLVAVRGGTAICALHGNDTIRLEPADPANAARRLLGALPRVPKAKGRSINVRNDETAASASPGMLGQDTDLRLSQHEQLDRLMREERMALAECNVATRVHGERLRTPNPIHILDNVTGRWLLKHVPPWVTATPADGALVLRTLDDMGAQLSAGSSSPTR